MAEFRVFVSAATAEYGSFRRGLASCTGNHRIRFTIQHETMYDTGRTPLREIQAHMATASVVVHFVGGDAGSAPSSNHYVDGVLGNEEQRVHLFNRFPFLRSLIAAVGGKPTYTQWEAYIAILLDKQLLVCQRRNASLDANKPGYLPWGKHLAHLESIGHAKQTRVFPDDGWFALELFILLDLLRLMEKKGAGGFDFHLPTIPKGDLHDPVLEVTRSEQSKPAEQTKTTNQVDLSENERPALFQNLLEKRKFGHLGPTE